MGLEDMVKSVIGKVAKEMERLKSQAVQITAYGYHQIKEMYKSIMDYTKRKTANMVNESGWGKNDDSRVG